MTDLSDELELQRRILAACGVVEVLVASAGWGRPWLPSAPAMPTMSEFDRAELALALDTVAAHPEDQ